MKKCLLICLFLASLPLLAQTQQTELQPTDPQPDQPVQTVSKSSLAARRVDSKLNEVTLHKTVLDYSLPPEIAQAAQTCTQAEEDCYYAFKTFENAPDNRLAAAANLELSVLALQRGMIQQAIEHIDKAVSLNPDDPFTTLTQGWTLLSAGKYKKARESFDRLFYLSADFEYVSSAKLGTALAWYLEGNNEKSAEQFQYLYTANPYVISFVSYMLGQIASQTKQARNMAPVFLQQSLSHDEKNYAAAKLFAQLSEKDKDKMRAWQYYATLYSLDPQNEDLARKIEKYSEDLGNKSIDYLFYLRLEQPIVHEMQSTPSEVVKMALYANREQVPQELKSVSIVASGTVRITDEKRGEVVRVPSYVEKTIEFNEQTRGVDFKNSKGQVEFSAMYPFKIMLEHDNKTLLVRNAQTENIFAADLSDKELKGELVVIPTENGFKLINKVYLEDLIPALLATQVKDVTQEEALKSLAVVLRSALLQAVKDNKNNPYHITDNDVKFQFKGINLIFKNLLDASNNSGEIRLMQAAAGAYANCGVVTAENILNTADKPNYQFSPANVSKYLLSNPPADLVSAPHDPTQWSAIKWMYLFEAKDIEQRIAQTKSIGKLRAITPTRLSPNGRILEMRFEGSKGDYLADTPQKISFVLGAGTLRSNFFDVVPLYKGKDIKQVFVRGYDTGLGEGLCLQGAQGLAKQGRDYKGIIKYYFPEARILDTQTGMIH